MPAPRGPSALGLRRHLALAAVALIAAAATACGAQASTPSAGPGTPTAISAAVPTSTPTTAPTPTPPPRWRTDLAVAGSVDAVAPDTTVTLRDGTTATLSAIAAGKPLLLYFFATWCPVCRAEFETLKTVYPPHADEVAFVAVGFRSSETIAKLAEFQDENEITWTMAEGPDDMLTRYEVLTQSTKLGIGPDGVVLFRHPYGISDAEVWQERLESLAGSGSLVGGA